MAFEINSPDHLFEAIRNRHLLQGTSAQWPGSDPNSQRHRTFGMDYIKPSSEWDSVSRPRHHCDAEKNNPRGKHNRNFFSTQLAVGR
jgi:hypothetical protein